MSTTTLDILWQLSRLLRSDDPDGVAEERFWNWLHDNAGNLRQACADLGVMVEDGPDFYVRMMTAVKAKLAEGDA